MGYSNIVLMFCGQGSQSVGMGREFAASFPEFKQVLEESSDILDLNVSELIFEDPHSKLNLTEYTQLALVTMSIGILRILLKHTPLLPDMVAGHSLGEYSALTAIGVLNFAAALQAVRFRGQAMQKAVPVGAGAMAAYIGTNTEQVAAICAQVSQERNLVEVANYNSSAQLVVSGHKAAVDAVLKKVEELKLGRCRLLPVSAPFHSSLMRSVASSMGNFLSNVPFNQGSGMIAANIDANIYNSSEYSKDLLVRQLYNPVLWTQSLKNIDQKFSDASWIEVGNGNVLQGLLKQTLNAPKVFSTGTLKDISSVIDFLNSPNL